MQNKHRLTAFVDVFTLYIQCHDLQTSMAVKTRIIRIGNSQGIRIPKPLLEQSGITGEVELEIEEGKIIIHAVEAPRRAWDEAFAAMVAQGDDALLDPDMIASEWDETAWQW